MMKYKDFEQALTRLEEIVDKMEKGDLPLESAVDLFEEGMRISRFCGSKLDEAERKVEALVKSQGEWKEVPFEAPEGDP